jgi:enterochelin esterase family protein
MPNPVRLLCLAASTALVALAFLPGPSRLLAAAPPGTDLYTLGPDSKPQEGVPKGKLIKAQITSKIYDGRVFTYQVYVPAQYDPAKPAALMVFQDGSNYVREVQPNGQPGAWFVHVVFDNLIHKKEMPVTIGVFVDPTSQRSQEYDSLGDRYARFLIEDLLPEVGKSWNITKDPEGHAISGFSSGAICAFTVAWERPDQFRKITTFFGSFTSIAWRPARGDQPAASGGEIYPTLIRRTPIKPLKIFIQDGSNDLNNQYGNWFLANQQMVSALEWANANPPGQGRGGRGARDGSASTNAPSLVRYQVNHAFGDGGHTANHGASLFPDILRWLWKDYQP